MSQISDFKVQIFKTDLNNYSRIINVIFNKKETN
jgi:hypothetical protein